MGRLKIKRPVIVKTIVTEEFKQNATTELSKEVSLLDRQIMQLEIQSRQVQEQIDYLSGQLNKNAEEQLKQGLIEIAQRIEQLSILKHEILTRLDSIDNIDLGEKMITGNLENYVEVGIGDDLYEKFKHAEIIIKDGIIVEIVE